MTEALQQEIRTLKNVFESERDPEGRVFAPLADAYRRAGEVQQAVRLLSEGLARHPEFVPGHVVAAQLYVEQGMVEEAGIAARNALELDGECVNALRSLLSVLEQNGDDEASQVRERLVALDPGFQPAEAAVATRTPLPDAAPAPDADETVAESEAGFADIEVPADDFSELGLATDDVALDLDAAALDLPVSPPAVDEEPLIDLDTLASVGSEPEAEEETVTLADLAPEAELPTEEPVVDLYDLAPIGLEADDDRATASLADADAEPVVELPDLAPSDYEEPVMDLADLGPPEAGDEEGEPVALADLAPDGDEEPVALVDLAPDAPAEEPVMELADLAPDEDEEPVALADLAPEPTEDEPVMDLADLAPAAGAEDDETVMEVEALAPETPEADEEVVALADLAPDEDEGEEPVALADLAPDAEEEPVMELADLAPDEDGEPVALADLAPEPTEDEPVMDLADLAPDEDEGEEPVALADLAPDAEEEPVMELSDLAPSAPFDEEPVALADLAPDEDDEVTVVGRMDEAPEPQPDSDTPIEADDDDDDVVIDLDALKPSEPTAGSAPEDSDTESATPSAGEDAAASGDDDHEPGAPVYTRTLAELYVKQGAIGQALDVYRHLSGLSPHDADLTRRIEELESGKGLEEEVEGVLSDEAEEEVEALARELAENADEAHEEPESPFTLEEAPDEGAEPEASGPTIGDYFEGLLGWSGKRS